MTSLELESREQIFALAVCSDRIDSNLYTALRAAQPSVIQLGGDYALLMTKHASKFQSLVDILTLAGLAPRTDFLAFGEAKYASG